MFLLTENFYDQKIVDAWGWITIKISNKSASVDYDWLDQKVVDGFGHLSSYFSGELKKTQSGIIQNYLLGGVLGILVIIMLFQ